MLDNLFAATSAGKMILRLLARLQTTLGASGLELRQDERPILKIGAIDAVYCDEPFSGFTLRIGAEAAAITPAVRRKLRVHRKVADILLRGLREGARTEAVDAKAYGRIGVEFLLDALLEIFLVMEERQRLLEQYQGILKLNERILTAEDLFETLQAVMDAASRATGGEGSSLLLVDQRTGEMYFNVVSGDNRSELREVRIPSGQGIAGAVIQSAKPELIRDVSADPRAFQKVDKLLGKTTRDMIIAPIIARGQVIGVIEVVNSLQPSGFLSEDLDVLVDIANHASLFIENSKGRDDLVRSNRELDRKNSEINALHEISRTLTASLEPGELKRELLRSLLRLMRIDHGAALEISPDRRRLVQNRVIFFGGDGLREETINAEFLEISDVLLWMTQYREPFYFTTPDQERAQELGLANRIRRSNPEAFDSAAAPDVWIPVFDPENKAPLFVIALGGVNLRRRQPADDLAFFRGLMSLCYTAFRNVESYREALLARQEEREIRQAFQKYVPLRIVQDMLADQQAAGPTVETVTCIFLDIRNFTSLAEITEPRELVRLLNEFFEEMAGAIRDYGGVIDKFMGDGFMALFGVPTAGADDASRALACLGTLFEKITLLNERRRASARPEFFASAAAHTGPVIVGNIGARNRMDFTAIGDSINLTSRLQKLCRVYDEEVLYTESTYVAAGARLPAREADLTLLRGRSAITRIYAPWTAARYDAPLSELEPRWATAIERYRTQRFEEARAGFAAVAAAARDGDRLASLYLERIDRLIANPPGPDWNGVFAVDAPGD